MSVYRIRNRKMKRMNKDDLLEQLSFGDCLVLPEESRVWKDIADKVEHTPDGPFYFLEGRGNERLPILGIAHLDCVMYTKARVRDGVVYSPTLDDRLGVWILLKYFLPLGVDILLTTGEEKCNSTAYWFRPDRDYNWIFGLDRAGIDCVIYQYYNEQFMCALNGSGWELGEGTFSDISFMQSLGIMAVNFGIGYYFEHTEGCYAEINVIRQQIQKVVRFVRMYHSVSFRQQTGR